MAGPQEAIIMKITSLVENTSRTGLPVEHGLSLHICLDDGRQILFDMGQRRLFAENAARLDVNLTDVEFAVVSHGHYDHGGGLRTFLELNRHAKVYLNRHAFEPHYSLRGDGLKYIGLSPDLKGHDRLVACGDAETRIDRDLILFAGVKSDSLKPPGNRLLFGPDQDSNDDFCHEQSLIIQEHGHAVLFAGCAHCGIVNIMQKAEAALSCPLTHVFAGMHLVKSGLTEEEETAFTRTLAGKLSAHVDCRYFTMHCTGLPQYKMLKTEMGNAITYMSCGDVVEI